ncbi:MAG: signal peptidase II, partial [Oscillospiraceae bacterium]|nr:signal peptidase II [Oscillospiraceae bacterium]
MLYAIIGLLVIIADQWTKFWVSGRVPVETTGEPFIPGILSYANVHNDGCAFSF